MRLVEAVQLESDGIIKPGGGNGLGEGRGNGFVGFGLEAEVGRKGCGVFQGQESDAETGVVVLEKREVNAVASDPTERKTCLAQEDSYTCFFLLFFRVKVQVELELEPGVGLSPADKGNTPWSI